MKFILSVAATAVAFAASAAPSIVIDSVQQRWPWDNKVEVTYTVSDDATSVLLGKVRITSVIGGVTHVVYDGKLGENASIGQHIVTWENPPAGVKRDDCKMIAEYSSVPVPTGDDYMIVRLADGAVSYEGVFADGKKFGFSSGQELSNARYNQDMYKTTHLVLRKVPKGTYPTQYGEKTTDKDYYIGVFPWTGYQYFHMFDLSVASMGLAPADYTKPRHFLKYAGDIRGTADPKSVPPPSKDRRWPILEWLNFKTSASGLVFDLPTELMHEIATRAGTSTAYYWGDDDASKYVVFGGSASGYACVGSKLPNAWGLYDMVGNDWEWCLDVQGGTRAVDDVFVPATGDGAQRVVRGGDYLSKTVAEVSSSRCGKASATDGTCSFRVACVIPSSMKVPAASATSAASSSVVSPSVTYSIDMTRAPVFDGNIPRAMRGGTWKVIYSSTEGPEGRALETLTARVGAHVLREGALATPFVLPLEKDGGARVDTKRDAIVVGVPSKNATLRGLLGEDAVKRLPSGGYMIKTMFKEGRNIVVVAGDTPSAVLWGVFDLLDVVAPGLEGRMADYHGRYPGLFFKGGKIPSYECVRAPETPVRSVFAWGHVLDDYNATFREMARARFNRAIIWNDQQVVNAKDVVDCAHSWGIEVYWGFSWGWGLNCDEADVHQLDKMSDSIVDEWKRIWKPMGGDGIYFQSFTETESQEIAGRSVAETVTELVNKTAKRIHADSPKTDIVFGLHSNSMRRPGAMDSIAKTDSSLEILWENCGGFPFSDYGWEPDAKFCEKILALTPSVGLVWKAQLRIDWPHFVRPAGPFMLGCASEKLISRDRDITLPRHAALDDQWEKNGKWAYDFVRRIRSGKCPPKELNAVAEYNPPYSFATHCQAELFWSAKDSWDDIAKRARMRARPER